MTLEEFVAKLVPEFPSFALTSSRDATLVEQLGMDSLEMLNLAAAIEELAGVQTSMDNVPSADLVTVGDAYDYYSALASGGQAAATTNLVRRVR